MISAKKRIALAITLAEPGGAQQFILRFALWLRDRGHEITVLAGEGSWLFDECEKHNIQTIRLRHLGRAINPLKDFLVILELRSVLRKLTPDALHLNSTKMGVVGSIASWLAHVPRIVYRIGGWVFLEPMSPTRRTLYILAEQFTARFKHIIICVHPGDAAIAQQKKICPREQITVIPNGIDLVTFDAHLASRADARTILNLSPETFVFGTVAHFYPAKNLVEYLKTCQKVHAQNPHTRFILIGDGPERESIERARAELHLENTVVLTGARHDASRLLRGLDTFVLPSVKEGMPWSLLEAMAAGLPCVATDVGANRWMLEPKAGWIVQVNDQAALVKIMLEILSNSREAQRRGAHARHVVKTRFPLQETLLKNEQTLLQSTSS